ATPEQETTRVAAELGAADVVRAPAWPAAADEVLIERLAAHAAPRVLPLDTAAVKLTSGSTGRPRGIVTPAAALVGDDAQLAASMGLREDERALAMVPMSHSYGLSSLAMPALMRGSTLVVAEDRGPLAPLLAGADCGATFLPAVPAWLAALVRL